MKQKKEVKKPKMAESKSADKKQDMKLLKKTVKKDCMK